MPACSVGDTFKSGQTQWPVVGIFDTDGTAAETEIWCDVRTLQGAFRRGNSYQSVLARLESPASFDAFKDWLSSNPQVDVDVKRESDYYREQSRTLTALVQGIGWGVAGLMGLGAIIGAVLTMYSAVVARTREIATLRALGFGSFPVLLSILGESMVLALVGGVTRRRARLCRLQRIPDVHHELADVQPGRVRLCRDADTADAGTRSTR